MANRKKKRASEPSSAPADKPKRGGNAGLIGLISVLVVLLGGGAVVTQHRKKDPARIWARTLEQVHAQKIEARLSHCFGGYDAESIRRLIGEVRRGNVPPPFRTCSGMSYTEVMASPMDFARDLRDPPASAEAAQLRERAKLERMRGALGNLERAMSGLDRNQPLPDSARERVATAIEDVAVEVGAERTTLSDLVIAAENGASWW